MSGEYGVRVTDQAREQLRVIVRYIAQTLQEPAAARRLLDTLENAIASLSRMPCRIALTEEEPWHGYGVRRMPVKGYLVYFLVDEIDTCVQVIAVVYGKRDQTLQLPQMDIE